MHVVWIHERAAAGGGAERYVHETALRLAERGLRSTLLYDPRLPTDVEFLRGFDAAFPLIDLATQLAELAPDVIYAHRVPAEAEHALAASDVRVVRFFHDHQLFCLREHKLRALGGEICERTVGAGCYPCGGFLRREKDGVRLVTLGSLRRRQRAAFSARAFVVASSYMAAQARAHGIAPDLVRVIPLYSEPQAERSIARRGFVFVGQLVRGKGVDVLVEAARIAGTPVTVVGDGPERASLEELVQRRGAPVTFVGWRSGTEVTAALAGARAAVIPSRVPETFGLVGIEAAAVGTPAIATNVGGMTEWLLDGSTGLAVPPDDASALARAMSRLQHDDLLAARLGRAAHVLHRARYSPESHLAALIDVLGGTSRAVEEVS